MFFFKRQNIILEAFTTNEHLTKTFPIQKSTNFYPEFWKTIPKTFRDENDFFDRPTIKLCNGLLDFYKDSFTIPLWSDLAIKTEQYKYIWQFSQSSAEAIHHNENQRTGFLENYHHLKLLSPWMLRCNKDIKFSFTEDTWNLQSNSSNIRVLNGVVDFKYQHGTNVNIMFPKTEKNYLLKCGSSIANLRPNTENKVILKVHCVTDFEYNKLLDVTKNYYFVNKYAKNKSAMKKCPFNWK